MKITDLTITMFSWDNIPETRYTRTWKPISGSVEMGLVTIHTDQGIEGHSFLGNSSMSAAIDAGQLINVLKPLVVGQEPRLVILRLRVVAHMVWDEVHDEAHRLCDRRRREPGVFGLAAQLGVDFVVIAHVVAVGAPGPGGEGRGDVAIGHAQRHQIRHDMTGVAEGEAAVELQAIGAHGNPRATWRPRRRHLHSLFPPIRQRPRSWWLSRRRSP